ncbi:MAG: hypothetical protein OXB84_03180, partial [Halobacteriovoraceae bacterium]|nr:hypothetical protein [Halobacteriovoraceae bacterium]
MNNKVLFAVFVVFCAAIYFFDERAQIKKEKLRDSKNRLFNHERPGEIKYIETPMVKLVKKDEYYYTEKGEVVDTLKLSYFLERLSKIRIERILGPAEIENMDYKSFFPNDKDKFVFKFENGEISFLLGRKLQVSQSFYIKVRKEKEETFVIANDPSSMDTPYLKEEEATSPHKYLRLKSLLLLNDRYFKDFHLFKEKYFKNISFGRAFINNIRNRPFSVDFTNKSSDPKVYPNLHYNSDAFVKFQEFIGDMRGNKSFHPYLPGKLREKLASIKLHSGNKEYELKLFRRYGELSGYFVTTSFDKVLYELAGKETVVFFLNVQDFWDKRPLSEQFGMKEESFAMAFDKGPKFKLKLPFGKNFEVSWNGKKNNNKPVKKSFTKLFSMLIGHADYVSVDKNFDLSK